jgi:putative flippase GtrA
LIAGPAVPDPLRERLGALFHESWKYVLVSAASLAVDQGVFWALIHFTPLNYLAANVFSVAAGLNVNYGLSVAWVFKERRLASRRVEFAGFVLIGLVGLAVNEAFVAALVGGLGLAPMVGKLAAAGPSFAFNFITRRVVLFTAAR